MLPLSHTYISTKVTGRNDPLLVFGSILPDISTASSRQIGRDKMHNSPNEFYKFVKENYPQLIDLGLGVRLHSQVDGGADFYSDDIKVGYAKLEGAKISESVAALLGIPNSDICLGLAHNFIEMAVDMHLYENQRDIWVIYKNSIEHVKPEFPKIAICVGNYLKIDQSLILNELRNLINVLNPNYLISNVIGVKNVAIPLIKLRFNKDVSYEETLKIAEKALERTEFTYKVFLDATVVSVKQNILGE